MWFVDIKKGFLHQLSGEGETSSIFLGGAPSFVFPTMQGNLLIGNRHALQVWDGDRLAVITLVSTHADNRLNDGTVDGEGHLWFGTMHDREEAPTGQLHRFDGAEIHVLGAAAIVTNGPAISSCGRWLYHVDSVGGLIWRFDLARGFVQERGEIFLRIDPTEGYPDGVTIDAEDHIWVGLWNGWAARRYAPDGRLVTQINFPCAHVTKIAFGGSDLRTAYATTARVGLSNEELAGQPLAGGLFAFDVEIPGLAIPPVRLLEE